MSITTPALPSLSHRTKHCNHHSALCTGQNLYADSASTTYMRGLSSSVALASAPTVSRMATARASSCTRGSATTLSASGTDALTPSSPPKLELVVTRGLSKSSTA
eukprot:1323095-Pleurochrysis_carterae.AAC.1